MANNRTAGYVLLFEVDVNRYRVSLIDYSGILADRLEGEVGPTLFRQISPSEFFLQQIEKIQTRNPDAAGALQSVSISVQGILDASGNRLEWSPIAHLAGHDVTEAIAEAHGIKARLFKRGRLMAEGMRWLRPELGRETVATIFIGSTVGMGLILNSDQTMHTDIGTEFGHMTHAPGGALCRCGAKGCIEAYAADYAILRTAYSVPEHAPPAKSVPPSDFSQLIGRARTGERNAVHAFSLAGQAIGYGINRLSAVLELDRIVLIGPGTTAFDILRPGIEEGMRASLLGKMRGIPPIDLVPDAGEPIYRGLMMKALTDLDRVFAFGANARNQAAQ